MIIDDKNRQLLMELRDINFILPAYVRQYLFAMRNEDPVRIVFPKFPTVPHPVKAGVTIPIVYIDMEDSLVDEIAKEGSVVAETPQVVEEVAESESHKQSGGGEDEVGGSAEQPATASEEDTKQDSLLEGMNKLKKWQSEHPPTEEEGLGSAKQKQEDDSIGGSEGVHIDQTDGIKVATPEDNPPSEQPKMTFKPREPKLPPGGDLGTGHADNLHSRDSRLDSKIARDLKDEPDVVEEKEIPIEIEKPKEKQ